MIFWLIIGASLLGIFTFFAVMPGECLLQQRVPFWGFNHAYGGLHSKNKTVPKCSIAAITAAIDAGYGIVLPLCLTADEQVVVFDDENLEAMCGIKNKVCELSFKQLSAQRLLATQQQIPHLWEVIDLVKQKVPIIFVLKPCGKNKKLCSIVWQILRSYDGDFCIASQCPSTLRWWMKKVPGVLRGQLCAQPKTGTGVLGFAVKNSLLNFIGRPQFIACQQGKQSGLTKFALHFCMSMFYIAGPKNNSESLQQEYDAVIFEFYEPEPRYFSPPSHENVEEKEEKQSFKY